MSVEVRPRGDACNLKCTYCYQERAREERRHERGGDTDAMIATLDRLDEPFTLFGGEVLLTRRADLERLLAFGFERYGGSGLQTNATLVTEADLATFARYNVRLGVSIDGPGELNDARIAGNPARTRSATAATEAVIERLCREGKPPSIIVTLHALNVRGDRLDVLCRWLRDLDRKGVRRVRLHVLQIDGSEAARLALSPEESLAALRHLRELERELSAIRFDLFDEIASLLQGDDSRASCAFHACDPFSTRAVVSVEADGALANCGRVNKEGTANGRAAVRSFDRQIALFATPQEEGGCAGCRFFLMCKGNCPGTAIAGDWRLRSADCPTWFALFADAEAALMAQGVDVLSRSPHRGATEAAMIAAWTQHDDPPLAEIRGRCSGEA